MRNFVIYSVLLFCIPIKSMDKYNEQLLQRSNCKIKFSMSDVEQMHAFDELTEGINFGVSWEKALDIWNFLEAAHAVKNGIMSRKYFGVKCELQCEARCTLSDLLKFRLSEIEDEDSGQRAIGAMWIAEEYKASSLGVIFLSALTTKIDHHKMFSAIIPSRDEIAFCQKMHKISNKKTVAKLAFFQKVYLYGIYERMKLRKLFWIPGDFIVPLMKGYAAKFAMQSLSKPLRKWAKKQVKELKKYKIV